MNKKLNKAAKKIKILFKRKIWKACHTLSRLIDDDDGRDGVTRFQKL